MSTSATSSRGRPIGEAVLAVAAALLILAVLTDTQLPVVTDARAGFFVLALVGFFMCPMGMTANVERLGRWHPINLIGYVLGVLAFALALHMLTGLALPLIADDRAAFVALAIIVVTKFVLAHLRLLPPLRRT